ncbi:NATD1-like protein [Mya arenaria]|uniref:Protein NATD1 n=1 Tax=Mya arenaria TaxID=6604 RepID=A0ABY7EQX9_MYAAR|nr:protein NATD1-like [Mya arenaria]WAR11221.1 NATD1-like protein [Mya arenaria]
MSMTRSILLISSWGKSFSKSHTACHHFKTHIAKMSTTVTNKDVIHDSSIREFYIPLKEEGFEGKAYLQYSFIKPDYVDLEHTVVPEHFQGRGIAKVLAKTVFDHFVDEQKYIRPTCTYLQKFYNDNPIPRYAEKVKWN